MENEQNRHEPEVENYPLDEALIGLLADVNVQMNALQARQQGALDLFSRQQKLQGSWRVAPNGRELVKVPAPPTPQVMPMP